MPSKCKINCDLHLEFEKAHNILKYLDKLEIIILRRRAELSPIGAQYDFITGKITRIRRLEKKISKRIRKITRILSSNGPGCYKCVAGGEDYEWAKRKDEKKKSMIRNFYVYKIVHSQNGRSWGWIVYIFSKCNVRKARKIKNLYHISYHNINKK